MSCVNSMKLLVLFSIINGIFIDAMIVKDKEKVVLVAPVLAPPKDSRARGVETETAKDFPVLMVLANGSKTDEEEAKAIVLPQPVYVQKLEDQKSQKLRNKRQFRLLF